MRPRSRGTIPPGAVKIIDGRLPPLDGMAPKKRPATGEPFAKRTAKH
jgi:hypothetical protein